MLYLQRGAPFELELLASFFLIHLMHVRASVGLVFCSVIGMLQLNLPVTATDSPALVPTPHLRWSGSTSRRHQRALRGPVLGESPFLLEVGRGVAVLGRGVWSVTVATIGRARGGWSQRMALAVTVATIGRARKGLSLRMTVVGLGRPTGAGG